MMRLHVGSIILVFVVACGGGGGTSPPTPPPPPGPPNISGVSPTSLIAATSSQTLAVSGTNFQTGMSLTVTPPSGNASTFSGAQIQSQTSTSFQVSVTLTATGSYAFQVANPNGDRSGAFPISVGVAAPPPSTWVKEGALLTDVTAGFPGQSIADVAAFQLRDGRWRLLFAAGGAGAIRSAISPDGLTLTMESGIRIDPRAALGGGAMAAGVKVLPLDDGRLRAYFHSLDGMYSAVSSDEGVTFAVEPGIRLAASAVGASVVPGGAVVRTRDGLWRMYFSDMASTPNAGPAPRKVFSASSSDLLTWTPDAGVRVGAGATLSGSAEHPCAITNSDGSVSIFYFRNNPTGTWAATSSDGVTFTTESMIFSSPMPGSGTIANDPDVVRLSDGSLRMYYNEGDDNGGTISSARRAGTSLTVDAKLGLLNGRATEASRNDARAIRALTDQVLTLMSPVQIPPAHSIR